MCLGNSPTVCIEPCIYPLPWRALYTHAVPLSDQVVGYLRELQQFSGPQSYVLPAFHTSRRPMSENTMNVAFRRMGYGICPKACFDEGASSTTGTPFPLMLSRC